MRWCQRKIGARKITFHIVKTGHKKLEGNDALYHPDESAVYFDAAIEPNKRRMLFVHECCHIIRDISGSNNESANAIADAEVREHIEEQQVRAETPLWHQFLEDNCFKFPKDPS